MARQVKAYLNFASVWRKRCVITLSELPVVVIDMVGGHKFIVIEVIEGNVSKIVIRANADCEFHREIFAEFRRGVPNLKVRCVGGGRINVDPTNNIIKIWDKSGDFGVEPNRADTVKMLSEAFPEFKVESSTPDW